MAAIFQTALMRLALCGLAVSLALLLFRSRLVRDTFARLLSSWRSITAFGRFAVCSFLLIGILIGGDKTNNVPPNMNQPQMQQGGGSFQTGFTGLTGFSGTGNHVNLVNPVQNNSPDQTTSAQQTFAQRRAANWNTRGAWKDSFWLAFEDGWSLPWGTNHLSGVEVVAQGEVWPTPFDTNAVASIGVAVEIVPGVSSFSFEHTPSNTYRFGWTNVAVNRDTNNLVSASLELFRNGDRVVTVDGVATYLPRTLPFPHDGYGQDDEWVEANFTNATEIATAGGYAAWVDQQVGEGLTNGLYKLTVSVAEDPPETTQITVGDLSVAVTNAGEYVFLMEKGEAYALSFSPPSTNISVSAVDDIAPMRGAPPLRGAWGWGDGVWSTDTGEFTCGYVSGAPLAECWWLPSLFGTPDVVHLGPSDPQAEFTAEIFDCAHPENATFEWSVGEGLVAASPNAQSTVVTAEDIPGWRRVVMSVTAWFGSAGPLTSFLGFSVGTNSTPQAGVSVAVPRAMFSNDDDDNDDGTNDWEKVSFSGLLDDHGGVSLDKIEDDVVSGGVSFRSDVPTNGTIRVSVSGFTGDVYTNMTEAALAPPTFEVPVDGLSDLEVPLYFNPYAHSPHLGPSVTATWIPADGDPQTSVSRLTVVEPAAEPIYYETKTASPQGESHVYTFNPCGVAVGDDAYFKVDVSPAAFPDSDIIWRRNNDNVEFVGGDSGREVHVRGKAVGETELEVVIGGRTRSAPCFTLNVVTQRTFKITAWIVTGKNDTFPRRVEDVENMIAPLNDIYRQVGVSFYLDSVIVTNIPDAYNLLYDSTTNGVWNYDGLVNVGHDTGGIECYFVNSFVFEDEAEGAIIAANCPSGLVMTAEAGVVTLAHEIGHAFGLSDIYVSTEEKPSIPSVPSPISVETNYVCLTAASWDWNGGCVGFGEGGCRYYSKATRMKSIIRRLIMYGIHDESGVARDITNGPVGGMSYVGDKNAAIWYDYDAPVGFFVNNNKKSSPAHQ